MRAGPWCRSTAALHETLVDNVAEVEAGRFRQDLYFRLAAARLHVPPLRARLDEIPLLAAAFLEEACACAGRTCIAISDDAVHALRAHAWPGNVRELRNLMQYFAATVEGDTLFGAEVEVRLSGATIAAAVTIVAARRAAARFGRWRTRCASSR